MAKPKRITYFKKSLEDRPGALLAIMQDLKSKNIGLVGMWGFSTEPGRGTLYVVAKNSDKLRDAWRNAGVFSEEGTGFYLKGTDRTGALVKTMEALAEAGVNLTAMDAVAAGAEFGSFIWVAPADVERAAQALGVK